MKNITKIVYITLLVMLLLFDISLHIPCIEVNDVSVVLGFIGVLATFIVVGQGLGQYIHEQKVSDAIKSMEYKISNMQDYAHIMSNAFSLFLQGEIYSTNRQYVLSMQCYLNAAYQFLTIGKSDIVNKLSSKIGQMIRNLRSRLNKDCGKYIIDCDLDVMKPEFLKELDTMFVKYNQEPVVQNYYNILTHYIKDKLAARSVHHGLELLLYSPNSQFVKRKNVFFFYIKDNEVINVFESYDMYIEDRESDLNVEYDAVSFYQCKNEQEYKDVLVQLNG